MSGSTEPRAETLIWLAPVLLLIVFVLFGFGLIASMTGEWDVALGDLGLLAAGIWVAKTPSG